MMKKIRTNWLGLLLAMAVIISLILSGLIWASPYANSHVRNDANNMNKQFTAQSIGDIYLPTEIVRVNGSGNQFRMYGQHANAALTAQNTLSKWHLLHLTRVGRGDSQDYLDTLRTPHSLVLSYATPIPTSIFNQTFSQELNTNRIPQIQRIVLPSNNQHVMYLLDDRNFQVYRVDITNNNTDKIKKLVQQSSGHQLPMDHQVVGKTLFTVYPHGVKLPVYAYQVVGQNVDNVTGNLLNTRQSSNLNQRREGQQITYSNNGRRLTYDESTGIIDYVNYTGKDSNPSTQQLYNTVYQRLRRIGTALDCLHFDDYSRKHQQITFRSYVQSFPIFNENDYGLVQITESNQGIEHFRFSRYSLQTPLPVKESSTRLPSTASILNQLKAAGKEKQVTGLRLGYLWQTGATHHGVTLEPTYLIKYHGNWLDYHDVLK
ncbi:YycH family regulatory protein [Limosilactobacillus sp.]|uniref:YycH family regulatory protein n=1 Tax=Limosilactobacillus sp. TaxID=2773925 RepID=UPI00345EE405